MLALLLLVLLALVPESRAQAPLLHSEVQGITIDAKSISYDKKTDEVTAVGDVVIRRGTTELRAEQVQLNQKTGEARASGNVELTDSEGVLFARKMDLNLEDETGSLFHGELLSKRYRYSLRGERIDKGLGQRYHIENGKFTTCLCEEGPPSWSVAANSLDIRLGGYGELKGGTLNVLDWPILYLPEVIFPVATERQSGFLLPKFGFSNRRGFQTIVPFYTVLNRSQDVTLGFDLESAARIGILGEYRYALSAGSGGELDASYFNEIFRSSLDRESTSRPVADPTIPANRWSIIGDHTQQLPFDNTGYVDLFLVSDDSFLREINTYAFDYAHDVQNRTRRYTESRVGAVHTWEHAAAQIDATYYQDLIQSQGLTLQRVPELRVWGQRSLSNLGYGGIDVSATSFQRTSGIDGLRLDLHPTLTLPIHTGLPLRATVHVGARETAYDLTENRMRGGLDPQSKAAWVLELPTQVSRETGELGAEISTEVSRVYDVQGRSLQRLKHTVEPILSYEYVPDVSQDNLPLFDNIDRINHRNLVTYGMVSRLFGRYTSAPDAPATAPSVRELGQVAIYQSYDVSRQIAPVGKPPGGSDSDHLSDIDLLVRANPLDSASILVRSSYDTSTSDISAAAVAVRFTDPRSRNGDRPARLDSRTTLTLGYRFITQNILQQVDAGLMLHLTDYLGALLATRYDVQNNQVLDSHVGFRLLSHCDCWGLDVGVTDRTNPSEVELRAQLTLVGLGSSSPPASGGPALP